MNSTCVLIIGGGTMAQAIIRGAELGGTSPPGGFILCEKDEAKLPALRALGHVRSAHTSITDAAAQIGPDDQILLAVKPQSFPDVAAELAPAIGSGRRIVTSILAGITSSVIRKSLGEQVAVVRAMPNTPAQISQGMTAIALGAGARPGDDSLAKKLLSGCSSVVEIDESLMDAFTALAGSGPAYVFYLAEAMEKAARKMGFDDAASEMIVQQTVAGAGALLKQSDANAQSLRTAVTSKGGTTAAATNVLDNEDVIGAFVRAILAGRDRGAELGKQ